MSVTLAGVKRILSEDHGPDCHKWEDKLRDATPMIPMSTLNTPTALAAGAPNTPTTRAAKAPQPSHGISAREQGDKTPTQDLGETRFVDASDTP